MGHKVKQITSWTQWSKWKLVLYSKTGIESRGWHQSQVYRCGCYRKDSLILNYGDYFVIVSYKQETITSLTESLNKVPGDYVLIDERDISNYLGDNIKKNSEETFELS